MTFSQIFTDSRRPFAMGKHALKQSTQETINIKQNLFKTKKQ